MNEDLKVTLLFAFGLLVCIAVWIILPVVGLLWLCGCL